MQGKRQKIREIVIVEGKYDKNVVSQIIDTLIVETSGFQIFNNKENMNLIKKLAKARGIVILTDSDSAGFMIRNHIKGSVPTDLIKHAYIPDIYGKERRKISPSKEGKLGVEGMSPEIIIDALRRAGATFIGDSNSSRYRNKSDKNDDRGPLKQCKAVDIEDIVDNEDRIELNDFFRVGLTGRRGSAGNRRILLKSLDLPERMSTNALLGVVNIIFTKSGFEDYVSDILLEK